MIKVSIMYPNTEGAKFDADYYVNKHIPLAESKLDGVRDVQVDIGVPGPGGAAAPYVGIVHFTFESVEAFGAAFGGPGMAEVGADMPNYTDIAPQIQVSEIRR
jgi:uncharacterized protein (TIGR02118 family)